MLMKETKDKQENLLLKILRKLGLGSLLSFIAGIVNSVGFLGFGLFVSHVSGHATYAAVEYSKHYYILAVTSFTAIIFFIMGAITTAVLMQGKTVEDPGITIYIPALIEAALLAYVMYGSFYYTDLQLTYDSYGHANFFLVLSFAMGMQNALLRKKYGPHIRTTHMTGTATDIGSSIGNILYLSLYSLVAKIISYIKYKLNLSPGISLDSVRVTYSKSQFDTLILNFFTLIFFGIGAILGTFGFIYLHFLILLLPIIILIVIAGIEFFFRKQKTQIS